MAKKTTTPAVPPGLQYADVQAAQAGKSAADIARTAVETTNRLSGDPNIAAYGGTQSKVVANNNGPGGSQLGVIGDPYVASASTPNAIVPANPNAPSLNPAPGQTPAPNSPGAPTLDLGGFNTSGKSFLDQQLLKVTEQTAKQNASIAAAKKAAQDAANADYQNDLNDISGQEMDTKQKEKGDIAGLNVNAGQYASGITNDTAQSEYNAALSARYANVYAALNNARSLASYRKTAALSKADADALDKSLANAQQQMDDLFKIHQQDVSEKNDAFSQGLQKAQFDQNIKEYETSLRDTARAFAMDNDIRTPFYIIGQTAFDTLTGQPLDYQSYIKAGGDPTFNPSKVKVIDPNAKIIKTLIAGWADKYADAGIDPTIDTVDSAQAKIRSSSIYREQVRPPSSGSGGGSAAALQSIFASTRTQIDQGQNRTDGGYVSPDVYMKLKKDWIAAQGSPDAFDAAFASDLNPTNGARNRVLGGVGTAQAGTGDSTSNANLASDRRIKVNVRPTKFGMDILKNLPVYDFDYLAGETGQTGLMAQDLNVVFPTAVHVGSDKDTDPWTIDYRKVVPLLIKALQEQQDQIDALKNK